MVGCLIGVSPCGPGGRSDCEHAGELVLALRTEVRRSLTRGAVLGCHPGELDRARTDSQPLGFRNRVELRRCHVGQYTRVSGQRKSPIRGLMSVSYTHLTL